MTRQVCLAQQGKASPADASRTFTILERAPLRLPGHKEVWTVLAANTQSRLVIDDASPEEAFPARVLGLAELARTDIDGAMSRARSAALTFEASHDGVPVLSKQLDRSYEQQQEWMRLRAVLMQAGRGKARARRVILLIG